VDTKIGGAIQKIKSSAKHIYVSKMRIAKKEANIGHSGDKKCDNFAIKS
jgi:hypothetical protein